MTERNFTIASGVYLNEQDLASRLSTYLTTTISGWSLLKSITNTATDRNLAFYGTGSDEDYDGAYVSIRGTGDELRFGIGSNFNSITNNYSDATYSADVQDILTGTTSGTYWFIGNKDAVHVSLMLPGPGFAKYHGGFGFWNSYYSPDYDPKPHYSFGQFVAGRTFTGDRCISYSPGSWGLSVNRVANNTLSGTSQIYNAARNGDLNNATPQKRTGQPYLFEPVFYSDVSFNTTEVRGEMPGLYFIGGTPYTHGNVITISGIGDISGKYFIHKFSDTVCWAIGKITIP